MVRPQACGEAVNNIFIFAAFLCVLPWLVEAQQQPRSALRQHEFPLEAITSEGMRTLLEATKVKTIETPLNIPRRKNTLSVNAGIHEKVDASADSAPLAPSHLAQSSRLESSSLQSTGWGSSQPSARDLQEWEVEDFVLLATVDGSVWARDRKTGKQKWRMELPEVSMISTKHHKKNKSADFNDVPTSKWGIDDYVWIVEPTEHGGLWIYRPDVPNGGLVDTGLTMKKLVDDMSPYQSDDPEVVYTGSRKTQMVQVDATNGKILQVFGGDYIVDTKDQSCSPKNGFVGREADECQNPTIWLGLSRYEVNIVGKDHHPIATLMYNEWGPNVQDAKKYGDKYHQTLDSKYILAGQDGRVMGFDRERNREHELLFQQKLPSAVVRVFDIFRPWGIEEKNLKLMMLPQPKPELRAENEVPGLDQNRNRVAINLSKDGSLYAMSGKSYPLAVAGDEAQIYQRGLWERKDYWQRMDQPELAEALTGVHFLDMQTEPLRTISAPLFEDVNQSKLTVTDLAPEILAGPTLLQSFQQIPKLAIDSVVEFIKNPVLILFLMILLISNQRQIRAWIGRHGFRHKKIFVLHKDRSTTKEMPAIHNSNDDSTNISSHEAARLPEIPEDKALDALPPDAKDSTSLPDAPGVTAAAVPLEGAAVNDAGSSSDVAQDVGDAASPAKKKPRKRGQRGGVKHRKAGRSTGHTGSDQESSQNPPLQKPPPTIEDAVHNAQNMFPPRTLEPDIQTVSNDPSEVSGSKIRIGALEVDQNRLVGTGSNGTMVFEGKFDGRAVAVKRMLIQFYDIASQETKLLRESDDHPNVIRYFAQQNAGGFLYIALELCPASLADVIEKPHLHRDLAQGGEKDLPNVLYQIANGIQHLHNLRIVHRDLKPQNILVAMGKNGKPRLLVSDFGLCKKLEVEQSSFRATTAHAAGTSGWRAPELLLDDDIKQGSMVDTSTDGGGSGSILVSSDMLPNRRATRAIDIFSLGLVFFYVLTKGSHPFDCGDRYMREVNIRKDNFDLGLLEILGDYAFEAKDLISSMLGKEPKSRPVAAQVMAHPFFWSAKKRLNFLCDVSDHFEKEKRDPPSPALLELERWAGDICHGDFLKPLGKEFVDSMGKQRKYTGTRLLDLLRALRNKKNHYEDMPDKLKKDVGPLPDGYLSFWTRKFPNLLIVCWNVVYEVEWDQVDRFKEYYQPAGL
ncbi:804b8cfb-f066-4a13-a6f2-6e898f9a95ee [Sclerotinia trifoliorum]|uniref:non-specific serine/threonine protein kinase n=1 Tax=Sclerotinia trifoliorum TaxID=28548 RepID=A0A8H2ZM65_9HELO|nr:804b8cfb-f066-4a13-a6f2-6e898f9a95ee [Sclerotinia trifoliorum]